MDNNKKNVKGKFKAAPKVNNDQLGENAMEEFAKDYDNKNNSTASKAKNKNNK